MARYKRRRLGEIRRAFLAFYRKNRSVHRPVLVQPQQIISAPESRPWAILNRLSRAHANRPGSPTLAPSHFVERCGPGAGDCRRRFRLDERSRRRSRTLRRFHSILGRRLRPAMASNQPGENLANGQRQMGDVQDQHRPHPLDHGERRRPIRGSIGRAHQGGRISSRPARQSAQLRNGTDFSRKARGIKEIQSPRRFDQSPRALAR
jgi:hypothetical protein